MNSAYDSRCSHRLDFSIRKSPDHRMLASPRGLSQLATSFIAFLRQGIPTHALSSLTIKFTHNTEQTHGPRGRVHGRQRIIERLSYSIRSPPAALIYVQPWPGISSSTSPLFRLARTCAVPVNIQLSNNSRFVRQDSASRDSHARITASVFLTAFVCPGCPDDGGPG
jgi:hypothetical protein